MNVKAATELGVWRAWQARHKSDRRHGRNARILAVVVMVSVTIAWIAFEASR
ncbi:MAG TPA: hypothetical protein VI485_16820 [Vicinamibacterales bacterium]|nr:hypothetical protein [Vicinamibacterales bacterium]